MSATKNNLKRPKQTSKTKKFKTWFIANWHELSFVLGFTILNLFFLNYATTEYSISTKRTIFLAIASIAIELFLSLVVFHAKKHNWPIEKIFLTLFIPLGLLFMIAFPIGRVPDENEQLARAWGISNGHFITTETNEDGIYSEYLPANLSYISKENTYAGTLAILSDTDETPTLVDDSLMAPYNFIDFLPQAFGILVGRVIGLHPLICAYLGRLCNFICFVLLFYFAIKKIPFGKVFLFFLAFIPVVLQEACSLSADCLTISATAALISFTLYLAYDKTATMTRKNSILLAILTSLVAFCKIVYLPLCFIILLIPTSKFKTKKSHILYTTILLISLVILNLLWLKLATSYLYETNPGVNPSEQLKNILGNPVNYLSVIFSTCFSDSYLFIQRAFAQLGFFDINLGSIYVLMSIVIFSILAYRLSEKTSLKIKPFDHLVTLCISISIIGLIFTSLYIQWNAVGNDTVTGIQGRYFIPVLALIPVIVYGLKKQPTNNKPAKENHSFLFLYSIFASVSALIFVICFHL